MESPRRRRDPIEKVLKEAARLERHLFEPAVDAVVEHLFKGASPTVAKKARRAALEAADKKHAEINIAAMRATLNEEEEHLRLWSQRHAITSAAILLSFVNTLMVAGVICIAAIGYHFTHSRLLSVAIAGAAVFLSARAFAVVIRKIIGAAMNVKQLEEPKPPRKTKPQIKSESGSPLGMTVTTARRLAARRLRRSAARAFVFYLAVGVMAYVFVQDLKISVLIPAPILIVVMICRQLRPLRNWEDAIVWMMLQPPS